MGGAPFEELIDAYGPELLAYLRRLTRSEADAEDCLQETFLRAYRAHPRLRPGSNPRAWLYKIATHVAYTHWRRVKRHQKALEQVGRPAQEPSVESQAESGTLVQAVREVVERLPHKQRTALILRRYQGLAYEEIGEALGCSAESARANAYQALKKLRAHFGEDER